MLLISRPVQRLLALAVCLAAAPAALAQITVTPRGDAAALDVAAWNIEFFGEPTEGPNDALQAERVQAVVERAGMDLWAFEEVVSTAGFNALVAAVADDGYAGVLGPNVSSSPVFNQRLAFIYNTSVIQVVSTQAVISGTNFGGRAPFEMIANVTLGGVTRQMRFIALHAKASSDLESYNKRLAGSAQLKTYVDGLLAQGIPVVVLGDFNDELTTSISGGRPSPYLNFIADANYSFATQRLNDQNIGTFCGNSPTCSTGSTIDHILLAGGAEAGYVADSGDRYGELLTGIPQYTQTTSDHLPVLARFTVAAVADEDGPEGAAVALLPAAPSPFRQATTLRFTLAAAADVSVEVIDVLGRTVARLGGAYGPGEHRLMLDGGAMPAGLYRVRLRAGDEVRVQTVVRAR